MGAWISFFLSICVGISAWADFKADYFELDSNKTKKLYTSENHVVEKDGQQFATTTFKDLKGNVVVEETATLRGSKVLKYVVDEKQTGEVATMEVVNNKILFSITKEGKTKKSEEDLGSTFVVPPNFSAYIKEHWDEIMKGETLKFRFGAWERMETVGFHLFKVGEGKIADQPVVELKLKAANFIIAAIVDPLFFKYTSDGSKLLEMRGRVAPKQKIGDRWKDLDAEVVYNHSK